MTFYVATINRPGYLPDSDTPAPLFRTTYEAWRYLYGEHSHAWDSDNDDELHLETDTQFHVHPYDEAGELHAADGYVYSVLEAELPANRVELFDHGSMSGSILIYTDEEAHVVRETISDNVGTWWDISRDYPDTDTEGDVLLSNGWEAHYNDDIILDSGVRYV